MALTAPVLNALAEKRADLRLTVRSGLPEERLKRRIQPVFEHIHAASDFGYVMRDATRIDLEASAAAYRNRHADWSRLLEADIRLLEQVAPDHVFSNVSELPLAAAAHLAIPSSALCSLNWADLLKHFFGREAWARALYRRMLNAYRSAQVFFRPSPGMPMAGLGNLKPVAPIAALGQRVDLGLGGDRAILIALGGITHRVPVENWPRVPGVRWLVPEEWSCGHPDALAMESFGLCFTDLLCSVDAILTKPGYGTFTEAACNGTPVFYLLREEWPEQDCLIAWLHEQGTARAVGRQELAEGDWAEALKWLAELSPLQRPRPDGGRQVAEALLELLSKARHRR